MNRCYAKIGAMSQERRALDATAISVMLLLTALWGFNQVTIKWIAADVSFVAQAAIRSILATGLLLAWAALKKQPLFSRDGTLLAGIAAGLLFAFEFVFIYGGLGHTNASRMSVFVYLAPPLTALGLHFMVAGERLGARQWLGVALAFAGLVLAFAEGFSAGRRHLARRPVRPRRGDSVGGDHGADPRHQPGAGQRREDVVLSAGGCPPRFCQSPRSRSGERGVVAINGARRSPRLAYQAVIVAFASYLAWFWLLTRYLAARLSVLSFLTPLFGMLSGVVFLSEPLSAHFALAALLIAAGIALVNLRR